MDITTFSFQIYRIFIFCGVGLCPLTLKAQVDSLRTIHLQDLVITASRMKEDISKSPVSIEKVSRTMIDQSPAPSFFDEPEHTRGNDKIFKSLGFMVTYRWQSSFYWQSFLVNGNVPAYQTLDVQMTYTRHNHSFKIGGTNIFNHYYNSFLGGPAVGGFYYIAVTVRLGGEKV